MFRWNRTGRVVLLLSVVAGTIAGAVGADEAGSGAPAFDVPNLPDELLVETYRRAARDNVLAAVNPRIFPGYFSVCADGQGFGFGNSYPSLDGHQMSDALLWLGRTGVVQANWDYVRTFQEPSGRLPLAILPARGGPRIGSETAQSTVHANGGLYEHWVDGNPLAALASPTFIQNADVIFRHTLDREWLERQIDAVNRAADYLASLTSHEGVVGGAGYYVERPTRIASDGVAQCHAVDAFRRAAALNRVLRRGGAAEKYDELAERIRHRFTTYFWADSHFAEYLHPSRGLITVRDLTDVDWAALATDVATPDQRATLWPRLRAESAFYYGGMPTGIAAQPDRYEDWEFTHPDRHDLAAMGRVWYLEGWARSRFRDADGLLDSLHRVAREGQAHDFFWRERYYPSSTGSPIPAGAEKYCEYPANFIRIVNQFLLGVQLDLDGSIVLSPCAPDAYWDRGFAHTVRRNDSVLAYRLQRDRVEITYSGGSSQAVAIHVKPDRDARPWQIEPPSAQCELRLEDASIYLTLPAAPPDAPLRVVVVR